MKKYILSIFLFPFSLWAVDINNPTTADNFNTRLSKHNANDTALETAVDALEAATSNIDNTSDANKPVSTAQQAALDLKADAANPSFTGVINLGSITSLEIPNSTAPTTDATGEIALDTSVPDHTPLIQYYSGAENMTVIAIPTADLVTTDDYIIKYDAATNQFTMEADAGGGGGSWGSITGTLSSQTDLQSALDLKAPLASPALTGNPTVPNQTTGDGDTSAANTAFVQQEIAAIDSLNLSYSASETAGEPLDADDSYSGPTFEGLNGGATIAQWEVVYFDGTAGEFLLADADGTGTRLAFGLATAATTDGNPISIIREGFVRNDAWAWTAGQRLYMGDTPGAITATAPSTSTDTVKEIGMAITDDVIFVDFGKLELTVE